MSDPRTLTAPPPPRQARRPRGLPRLRQLLRVPGDGLLAAIVVGLLAAGAAVIVVSQLGAGQHHHRGGIAGILAYQGMWLAMVIAMMLPTATPMARALTRLLRGSPDRGRVLASCTVAYLSVWAVAGLAAWTITTLSDPWLPAGDPVTEALRTALGRPGDMITNAPAMLGPMAEPMASPPDPSAALWVSAALLAVCGALQLSPLTSRCIRACRSPAGFFARHWTGRPDRIRQGFRIGIAYGWSCLGCCAALMAALTLFGMQDLTLMALGGTAMALQKNHRHGRTIARGLGALLLLTAAALAATAATGPALH